MSTEVRLVGGHVVTQNATRQILTPGEVAFDPATGNLTYVGEPRGAGGTDVSGRIVMPGLVNAHTHSGMTPLRGYAEDLNLQDWLAKVRDFEVLLTADDLSWALQLALAEMMRTGTTTFADMFLWNTTLLTAVADAGMRVLAAPAVFGYDAVAYPGASTDTGADVLATTEKLAQEFAGDRHIRVAFGPHAPYTCPPDLLTHLASRARALDIPVEIHLSESRFEVDQSLADYGRTPIAHAASLGLFDSSVLVAHATHATDDDMTILADSGAAVAHNPVSNLKLGAGVAPVRRLRDAGVPLGLGTDSVASNNSLDLFEELKLGVLLQRGVNESPDVVRSTELLVMATREGAQAVGFPEVGSLEVGKRADVVVAEPGRTRGIPLHDPASYLAFSASGAADVRDVYIGGRQVVADGEVTALDEEQARHRVASAAARITRELGAS